MVDMFKFITSITSVVLQKVLESKKLPSICFSIYFLLEGFVILKTKERTEIVWQIMFLLQEMTQNLWAIDLGWRRFWWQNPAATT